MTRRQLLAALAATVSLLGQAQVSEQAGVELEKGLLLHPEAKVDLAHHQDGVFQLPDNVDPKVGDFTFTCTLRLDHEPGNVGDHALEFALVQFTKFAPVVLAMGSEGTIRLRISGLGAEGGFAARPLRPLANRDIDIAVVIKRDARQALSGLWIDGVEAESFNTPPGVETLDEQAIAIDGTLHSGIVSHLRLYNRALTRPEIIALADLARPPASAGSIALLGSTEAVLMAESGWLDAYLALKQAGLPPDKRLALRNLAWEGDTVWRQDRPLNFGPLAQQLDRVQARQAVLLFGRQECLERGEAGLADFRSALEALVAKCPAGALLMGCVPFEAKAPPQRDLSALNPVLARYDDVIKAVAEAQGGRFFDTRQSWRKQEDTWTRDGVTLTPMGEWLLGDVTAFALGWRGQDPGEAGLAKLRALAQAKERLWHQYWRPSNWAFLYGDRTTQPSSRDHLNPSVRWFPQELEQYRRLIADKESELWKQSDNLGRKLP